MKLGMVAGVGGGPGDISVLAVVRLEKEEAIREGVMAKMPKVVLGETFGSWR
jgi:hypothetical protein